MEISQRRRIRMPQTNGCGLPDRERSAGKAALPLFPVSHPFLLDLGPTRPPSPCSPARSTDSSCCRYFVKKSVGRPQPRAVMPPTMSPAWVRFDREELIIDRLHWSALVRPVENHLVAGDGGRSTYRPGNGFAASRNVNLTKSDALRSTSGQEGWSTSLTNSLAGLWRFC
jgi:hypothetical protein